MRAIALLMWAGILTVGWMRLAVPPQAPSGADEAAGCAPVAEHGEILGVAARDLPLNWRMTSSDLRPSGAADATEWVGRYAGCEIPEGSPITSAHVRATPQIPLADGTVLTALPITPAQSADLNAGVVVEVLRDQTMLFQEPVAAVECAAACLAWFLTSPAEHHLALSSPPQDIRLVVRLLAD